MLKQQYLMWNTLQKAISEPQDSKSEHESKQCEAALNHTRASLFAIAQE